MTDKLWRSSAVYQIWSQSKANGGEYHGEDLPAYKWAWPEGWLEKRRRELAQKENDDEQT